MNDHVVAPILRDLTGAHVAAHSHIEKHVPVPHGPRSRRDKGLHDSLPIDPPEHPPLTGCAAGLVPSEVEAHRTGVHIRDGGAHGTVLERLVVEAPMQTRLVLVVGVPRFGHIGLAVSRPHEGLARQQPECRPDAVGAGQRQHGRQDPGVAA